MKNGMAVVIVVLAAAAGCKAKVDTREGQLANLEDRLANAERRLHGTGESISNLTSKVDELDKTDRWYWDKTHSEIMVLLTNGLKVMEMLEQVVENQATNAARPGPVRYLQVPAPAAPQRYAVGTTKDGVPAVIYNEIAARAAERWKSDYSMQVYEIRNEVEAYRKLHP